MYSFAIPESIHGGEGINQLWLANMCVCVCVCIDNSAEIGPKKICISQCIFHRCIFRRTWEGILAVDMMSSEESATKGDEEVYLHR